MTTWVMYLPSLSYPMHGEKILDPSFLSIPFLFLSFFLSVLLLQLETLLKARTPGTTQREMLNELAPDAQRSGHTSLMPNTEQIETLPCCRVDFDPEAVTFFGLLG